MQRLGEIKSLIDEDIRLDKIRFGDPCLFFTELLNRMPEKSSLNYFSFF